MTIPLHEKAGYRPAGLMDLVGYGPLVPASFGDPEREYVRLRSGAAWFDHSSCGRIRVTGKDAVNLLQRLSTNDVLSVSPGQLVKTVLTNEKGRIIDLVTVVHEQHSLFLLTSVANSTRIMKWIDRFIIMEDVHLEDLTSAMFQISVFGDTDVAPALVSLSKSHPEVLVCEDATTNSTIVLGPANTAVDVLGVLKSAGVDPVGVLAAESNRIESRLPLFGHELSDQYNPIEVGLSELISFTKGCYIGQEVIARLDSYNKVQRSLLLLQLDNGAAGSKCNFIDPRVGAITSIAYSYGRKADLALAVVKNEFTNNPAFELISESGEKIIAHKLLK